MFPTKRLNPVAGTLNPTFDMPEWYQFPTKRLNPVAGTLFTGQYSMLKICMVSNKAT